MLSTPVVERNLLKNMNWVVENEVKEEKKSKTAKTTKMGAVINSAYSGEVLDQLLVKATTGNQMVAGGHIRVEPITHKFHTTLTS